MIRIAVPAFLTVLSAAFLVGLGKGLVANLARRRRSVRVTGVITDLHAVEPYVGTPTSGQRRTQYAPVLEFQTLDGRRIRTESRVSSNPPVGEPGQRVQIGYDPDDPTEAYVDTVPGSGLLLYAGGLVIAGIVFVVAVGVLVSRLGS